MSPAKSFRALHETFGAFIIPNPWDAGSARLLETLGFRALATTSAGMAFGLGLRDGSVHREAILEHCRSIVAATTLPVSADLEKGFGDTPECVFDTIVAAAGTGLAGCSIEDHTGNPDKPIFELPLAVARIEAAVDACRSLDDDFVLTARCDNLLWGRRGLDEVINRLQAYESAGADVLYAPGLRDLDTIRQVCSAVSVPVNVVMEMPSAPFSVEELAGVGVKRISLGAVLARLAYSSLLHAGAEMSKSGTFGFAKDAMSFNRLNDLFPTPE